MADYYDNQGTWYYDNVALNSHTKNAEAIRDLSRLSVASVLDVGCGDGSFLQQLRQLGIRKLCGLELSPVLVRAAKEKGLQVDCKPIEQVEDNFDLLTLLDVAEHVQYPSEFFSSCCRALKVNGYVYIHTPRRCFWDEIFLRLAKFSLTRRLAHIWLNSRVSMAHLQLWSDRALSRTIDQAGMRVLEYRKELELSWPLDKYVNHYLSKFSPRVRKAATALIRILVLPTMKNKAVVLAQKA